MFIKTYQGLEFQEKEVLIGLWSVEAGREVGELGAEATLVLAEAEEVEVTLVVAEVYHYNPPPPPQQAGVRVAEAVGHDVFWRRAFLECRSGEQGN